MSDEKKYKFDEPIIQRKDGTYVVQYNGNPYQVTDTTVSVTMEELQVYLAEFPESVQPEPLPPPPTDAQLESAAESQRQARFAEYDTAIMRLKRAERLGDPNATASIAQWDGYAVALQVLNDSPGWFRDPQWPPKPEV